MLMLEVRQPTVRGVRILASPTRKYSGLFGCWVCRARVRPLRRRDTMVRLFRRAHRGRKKSFARWIQP